MYQHGMLPHWRQVGCTYFVTFRLDDSLPLPVVREMEHERHQWLQRHGIDSQAANWKALFARLPPETRRDYERRIGVSLDKHLDAGHGSCALKTPSIAQIVSKALTYFHGTRVYSGDYVVMPNHVHALLRPIDEHELEDILHSIKSYTANQINKVMERSGELWQRQSYDHIVRDFDQLKAFQEYIAANPVKAKLNTGEFLSHRAAWRPDE